MPILVSAASAFHHFLSFSCLLFFSSTVRCQNARPGAPRNCGLNAGHTSLPPSCLFCGSARREKRRAKTPSCRNAFFKYIFSVLSSENQERLQRCRQNLSFPLEGASASKLCFQLHGENRLLCASLLRGEATN